MTAPEFSYEDLLPIGPDTTEYRKISSDGVSTFTAEGKEFLKVAPEAITNLTEVAIHDISHYLRAAHIQQLQMIDLLHWIF
jgi:fumarate hydratase class I